MAIRRPARPTAPPVAVQLLILAIVIVTPAWLALGHANDHNRWTLAQATVGSFVAAAAVLLVSRRVQAGKDERALWRWLTCALAAVAVGFVGQEVLTVVKSTTPLPSSRWQQLPLSICALLACLAIYQGLVRWNRFRSVMAEPADWLNGVGSVLAMAALGNLIVRWTDSPLSQWPAWELQSWLLRVAAVLVLLGTATTVMSLAGLTRDLRAWVICAALAAILGFEILSASSRTPTSFGVWAQLGWMLGAAAIACCAFGKPGELKPRTSSTQSETVGAFVVLVVSAAILVLNDAVDVRHSSIVTLFGGLAFLCAGTRAIHITQSLSQLAQSRLEARSDELTGIANRRELVERLGDLVAIRAVVGLLIIDLDRFKEVNDRFGHAAGDTLLRLTSGRLQHRMPRNALLARLGGDEFAVLLDGASLQSAATLAEALAKALTKPVDIDGHLISVGASIGVAALPSPIGPGPDDDKGEELLRRADVAMYLAKRAGGGVSVYDAAVDRATREQTVRVDELTAMLESDATSPDNQLVVHYQPQICLRTGHVLGAEALVRWQHPQRGLLGPATFLELVESHGLMERLTARVLHEATAQVLRWHALDHPLRVSVNLSTSSLTSKSLLPLIDSLLSTTALDPADLTLEITETSFIADSELALRTTREIAARGIAVSIDDYGTGYSSLSYLNDLPATELKLDRSFTARVVTNDRTAAIVAGTIELGHRLGLRVVAEGVEDQAALDALRSLDCDEVQGYHCGYPMPAADFELWLEAHRRPAHAMSLRVT